MTARSAITVCRSFHFIKGLAPGRARTNDYPRNENIVWRLILPDAGASRHHSIWYCRQK